MTVKEMNEVIQEHCGKQEFPCEGHCVLSKICTSIRGDFLAHPTECVQAYYIIKAPEVVKEIEQILETEYPPFKPSKPFGTTDKVDHPSHYNQGGIECIDAMTSAFGKEAVKHFCICNAFKYVWRSEHKNGIEDIDKAIWYLNKVKELSADE